MTVLLDPQGTPDTLETTAGKDGTFDVRLQGTGRDRGEYAITARQRDANGTVLRASRTFSVPCVEPVLTIAPAIRTRVAMRHSSRAPTSRRARP